MPTANVNSGHGLLRLLQLASPTLPVGAFAYSQGLEYAVECGWVRDEPDTLAWIGGQVSHTLANVDLPVLARLYHAWETHDDTCATYWSRHLLCMRESGELRTQDRQLGQALACLLNDLGVEPASAWRRNPDSSYACQFALAAHAWRIPLCDAAHGYLWAWCEGQVTAAVKLVPLGQTAGQRLLSALLPAIAIAADHGLQVLDDDIGAAAPGVGIASALHETQYCRLFRS